MPRPKFLIAALALLQLLPACADSSRAMREAPGSVWVVESKTTKLYLCGTIHLLRKSDYPLPATYEQAYADSQRLVFELPPGTARDPALGAKMAQLGSFEGEQGLQASITPAMWASLSSWANGRGVPLATFVKHRPWYAALAISMTEYVALGADPSRGVDQEFERLMDKDHKSGEGLETMEQQISLFTSLTAEEQSELLEQTLAEVKTLPEVFNKMIVAWKNGDADALHKMLFEEAQKYPQLLDRFLTQRNASWIKRLEQLLAGKEHAMVLVGTGHLGGKDGVLELLRAKGYTVRALSAKAPDAP
jgi:hypothetical protein